MKKEVWILRQDDMLDMLQATEEQFQNLDPMPSDEYLKGLQAGIEIARKITNRICYEAYEYDAHEKKDTVLA